jgi:hypothetical protein
LGPVLSYLAENTGIWQQWHCYGSETVSFYWRKAEAGAGAGAIVDAPTVLVLTLIYGMARKSSIKTIPINIFK